MLHPPIFEQIKPGDKPVDQQQAGNLSNTHFPINNPPNVTRPRNQSNPGNDFYLFPSFFMRFWWITVFLFCYII